MVVHGGGEATRRWLRRCRLAMPLVATKKCYLMAWAVLDLAKKKKHCVGEKKTIDKISSSWWT
jgi:hypothetical protein